MSFNLSTAEDVVIKDCLDFLDASDIGGPELSDRKILAEYVVCMAQTKKTRHEIALEIEPFVKVNGHAEQVAIWLENHIESLRKEGPDEREKEKEEEPKRRHRKRKNDHDSRGPSRSRRRRREEDRDERRKRRSSRKHREKRDRHERDYYNWYDYRDDRYRRDKYEERRSEKERDFDWNSSNYDRFRERKVANERRKERMDDSILLHQTREAIERRNKKFCLAQNFGHKSEVVPTQQDVVVRAQMTKLELLGLYTEQLQVLISKKNKAATEEEKEHCKIRIKEIQEKMSALKEPEKKEDGGEEIEPQQLAPPVHQNRTWVKEEKPEEAKDSELGRKSL